MLVWLPMLAIETLWKRRRSRDQFRRQLRQYGLAPDVVDSLAERYHAPGLLRAAIRGWERSEGHDGAH